MRFASLCMGLATWLLAPDAHAQAAARTCTMAPCPAPLFSARQDTETRHPAAFAYGAAIVGSVSTALVLGGAIAIAAVDDVDSERITRGLWLGAATLTVPVVALGAWTARKRVKVQGERQLRILGWTAWSGALVNGILQWHGAFQGTSQPWGLTVGAGAMGALAILPHALDAFISAHRAFMRTRYGTVAIVPVPNGLMVRF